jgi:hypothetical protein
MSRRACDVSDDGVGHMLIVVTSAAAARTALLADLSGRPYRSYNRRFSID